ncbi:MAG: repressor LexA [Porticoccaceae bacterium]|nr:repressor LexA [Porticoccaceae bacterium]
MSTDTVKLTRRQQEIFDLIRDSIIIDGYPPTRAEIARHFNFKSPNAAEDHLRTLARKGVIEMTPGASRGIRLVEVESGLPVVGRVAAGSPILAQEHIEEHYAVSPDVFHPIADYFLRVQGESMRDVGILDGDLLAVHRTEHVENGQIVVARIDDEVTVKRFKRTRSPHRINLLPENPDFKVIEVDLRETPFAIEGISVGIIRTTH